MREEMAPMKQQQQQIRTILQNNNIRRINTTEAALSNKNAIRRLLRLELFCQWKHDLQFRNFYAVNK